MAFSPFATYAFVGTNYNKVASGDWTRYPVLAGQCINAVQATVDSGAKVSAKVAHAADKTSSVFEKLAQSDKVFNGLSKTVKFVKNNINPLIVASGATKVILAKKEDREKTLFSEGSMILGMFAGEGWMKKNLDKVILSKLPIDKKWAPIVKGVLFVAGSLTASTIGQKIGEATFAKIDKDRHKKAAQILNENVLQQNIQPYEPMRVKA